MAAYQAGNVTLANAVGTGIADDKAIYSYMPDIVKFYLGEEPILKNVPTWRCREDGASRLRARPPRGAGGQGGARLRRLRHADRAEGRQGARSQRSAPSSSRDPKNFIAQPTLALSTCPTCVEAGLAPRHVDLRPFVLTGRDRIRIVPGGLTRVALQEGLAGRQFEPGRRHQGHLGAGSRDECFPAPPTTSTGSPATSSARNISRASSKRRIGSPLCRSPTSATSNEWDSAVATAGCAGASSPPTRRPTRRPSPISWLLDRQSIVDPQLLRGRAHQCARGAHRAHRGDVGRDQRRLARAQALRQRADLARGVLRFLRWVQESSLRFDGSAYRTMLRNDAYWFSRLGVFIERADNTARILDVKYHLLLPAHEQSAVRSTISSGRRSCARSRR